MYDTINLRLLSEHPNDFKKVVINYLENIGEHYYTDQQTITGDIGRLKVIVSERELKIGGGSICKWFLGDNFKTMRRADMKAAVEKLSDIMHVPIKKAEVTRVDIGQNFIMKFCPMAYFIHLGGLIRTDRLEQPNGLYYNTSRRKLCFYDKNKESRNKQEIPILYRGENVLRYEIRYCNNIAYQLKTNRLTAETLYNGTFYISLLNRWRDTYNSIQKIKSTSINFNMIKTKRELHKAAISLFIEKMGGEAKVTEDIKEALIKKRITKKQAYDLRQAIKEAGEGNNNIVEENNIIEELNTKVNEAVKYYL